MIIEGYEESEPKRILKETIKAYNCQICSFLQEAIKIFTVKIENNNWSLADYVNNNKLLKLNNKDLSDKDIAFYSRIENRRELNKEHLRISIHFLEAKDYSYKVGCSVTYL